VTSNNACEPGEQLIVLANCDDESDLLGCYLLLLATTVRSSAHMPLGISDRNSAKVRIELKTIHTADPDVFSTLPQWCC